MDIGSLFLILALLILVGLFVSRPFFEPKATAVTKQEHDLSALLAEKDRTLTALQELEFDFVLGKIPEENYPAQRAFLVQKGIEVLQRLDGLQDQTLPIQSTGPVKITGTVMSPELVKNAVERLDVEVVERLVSQEAARGKNTVVTSGGNGGGNYPDDPVEALIAARRRNRQGKAAGFCHKCGGPLQQSDLFCPKCGTAVKDN
jgi:hypothetical protein